MLSRGKLGGVINALSWTILEAKLMDMLTHSLNHHCSISSSLFSNKEWHCMKEQHINNLVGGMH